MMWGNQAEGLVEYGRTGYDAKRDSVSGVGGRFHTVKGQYSEIFPCNDPVNPHYADYNKRLESFQVQPWHQNKHAPKPERLAAAGLFNLGDKDRCKCYYCNGGLQNWEDGDEPMVEHAKYFPQCEFVLQHKGPDFVAELNAKFPNLARPGVPSDTSHSQQTLHSNQPLRNGAAYQQRYQTPLSSGFQDGNYADDTVAASNEANRQGHSDGTGQGLVNLALAFGFDKNLVMSVIARRQPDTPFNNLAELIDELLSTESNQPINRTPERMNVRGHEPSNRMTQISPREVLADDIPQPDLKSQLQSALDESMCLTCHNRERSCVFMNCGHLSCCYECGRIVKQCPICNSPVLQTIKIYKT